MNPRQYSLVASCALWLLGATIAWRAHAEPLPANSHYELSLTEPVVFARPIVQRGAFRDSHPEKELVASSPIATQIARFEVDLDRGVLRGFHSGLNASLADPATSSVTVHWGPTVRVVSTGATGSGTVPLELRVRLHGEFDTDDLASQYAQAIQRFTATLAPLRLGGPTGSTVQLARLDYQYRYLGRSSPTNFAHERAATTSEEDCVGCLAEVTGVDEAFAFGFENVVLHTILHVSTEDLIDLNFTLSGRTSVLAFGAYGDWSRTAAFSFGLPEGYTLQTEDGIPLAGWNARSDGPGSSVPQPATLALIAAAGGAFGIGSGARIRSARRRLSAGTP